MTADLKVKSTSGKVELSQLSLNFLFMEYISSTKLHIALYVDVKPEAIFQISLNLISMCAGLLLNFGVCQGTNRAATFFKKVVKAHTFYANFRQR